MGYYTCCVVNCKNSGKNSSCKFYTFSRQNWKLDQRNKWIAAVKRTNADGSPWYPKPHHTICSDHFIGGKKSDAEASPSYVPTIFPSIYRCKKTNHSQMTARFNRLMKRRYPDKQFITNDEQKLLPIETVIIKIEKDLSMMDEESQTEETFTSNRSTQNNNCIAEIKSEIPTSEMSPDFHQKLKIKDFALIK